MKLDRRAISVNNRGMGFFKPTKAKIYLTFLLVIIPFALSDLIQFVPIFSIIQAPFSSLDDFLFSIFPASFNDVPAYASIISSIFLVLYILARYLIACVLVSLFNALNINSNKKRAPAK
jgi:hypothetical protein